MLQAFALACCVTCLPCKLRLWMPAAMQKAWWSSADDLYALRATHFGRLFRQGFKHRTAKYTIFAAQTLVPGARGPSFRAWLALKAWKGNRADGGFNVPNCGNGHGACGCLSAAVLVQFASFGLLLTSQVID